MHSLRKSKIILCKKRIFYSNNNENFLILTDGKILNISEGKTNSFDFIKPKLIYQNIHQKQ